MKDRAELIKKLIAESGNNFHYSMVRFLREKEWTVTVSPYYSDYATDQSREVNIIAEKSYDVHVPLFRQFAGVINVRLIIEYKHINGEIAFWFDDKNMPKSRARVASDTSHTYTQDHHYLTDKRVAKLFSKKYGSDQDMIYKALTQTLHALIYYKEHNIPWVLPQHHTKIVANLNYPVIVCNSFENLY